MPRRYRLLGLVLALSLAPTIVAAGPATSLARLTDSAVSTQAMTTDTLAPPTGLTASSGASAGLAWTITNDAYATGYEVHRATVSGGPYSQVGTVTPRAATSTTDTPATSGTYYYVLKSYFQNWLSAASNEASAMVTLPSVATGFKGCTGASNAADTGGDGNGYETSPANACGDDALVASDANSGTSTTVSCSNAGKDRHRFWDFGLGVPASVYAVDGIQVRLDEGLAATGGSIQVCVELSSNGGSTWTAAKSVSITTATITTYNLGATNDTWGRSWFGSDFSNANFRVRITDVASTTSKTFRLEYLAVQVTYTP
jgi:hypothetical protein